MAYLKEVIEKMGVQDVQFSAVQKGEATIICLDGEKLGALIGRRGETMGSTVDPGQPGRQTAWRAIISSWAWMRPGYRG